jgi:hypothetical protein
LKKNPARFKRATVRDPSLFPSSIQLNDRINPFSRSDGSIYPPKTMAGIGGDLHTFASHHVFEIGKELPLDLKIQEQQEVLWTERQQHSSAVCSSFHHRRRHGAVGEMTLLRHVAKKIFDNDESVA